jgi:prephenate dehydratase
MPKIGYLGPEFSYHHLAAQKAFNQAENTGEYQLVSIPDFESIFVQVCNKQVDLGLVALRNNLAGIVTEVADLLTKYSSKIEITGEVNLPISHCLMAKPEVVLKDLTKIYSHPKALEQCQQFQKSHPKIAFEPAKSTSEAARIVSISKNNTYAAIGSKESAEHLGLDVLSQNVQDSDYNSTKFVIFR